MSELLPNNKDDSTKSLSLITIDGVNIINENSSLITVTFGEKSIQIDWPKNWDESFTYFANDLAKINNLERPKVLIVAKDEGLLQNAGAEDVRYKGGSTLQTLKNSRKKQHKYSIKNSIKNRILRLPSTDSSRSQSPFATLKASDRSKHVKSMKHIKKKKHKYTRILH